MTVWSKIAEENGTSVAIAANVRFGVPGNWTTPVAINGTTLTTAATFGRVTAPTLLGQLQADSADSQNRYMKIMVIGDQISQLMGSTGWQTQLQTLIAAQSRFYPTDFVGNAIYTFNDQSYDPDNNAYASYVCTNLTKTSGTGSAGTGWLGDSRDVTNWFAEQAPDIVLVHLGTQDCINGTIVTANLTAAYAALLTAARAAKSSVIFYVCKPIKHTNATINTQLSLLATAIGTWVLTVDTALSPVDFIDMNTSFNTGTMLQGGGVLPNSTGATFMATQAFNKLDPWLLKPAKYPLTSGQPNFNRVAITLGLGSTLSYPIDISSAVGWWIPPPTGTSDLMTGSSYKLSSGQMLNVVTQGGLVGFATASSGTFIWTNGLGNQNYTSGGYHNSTTQTIGHGYIITMNMPKWPAFYKIRIIVSTANPTQIDFVASSNDPNSVSMTVGIGTNTDYDDFKNLYPADFQFVDFRCSSDVAGKTLTINMARTGTSMGFWAIFGAVVYLDVPEPLLQEPPSFAMMGLIGGLR